MKLIIDIDDEMVCNDIKNKALEPTSATDEVITNALYNGIPYEERLQGDLISRSEAEKLGATCLARRNANGQLEAIISLENVPTVNIPNYGGKVVPDTLQGWRYEERQQGEWIDYDNTFYKCPDCGYLLEKCCPQCQNKVILPKGGAEK